MNAENAEKQYLALKKTVVKEIKAHVAKTEAGEITLKRKIIIAHSQDDPNDTTTISAVDEHGIVTTQQHGWDNIAKYLYEIQLPHLIDILAQVEH